MLTAGEEKVNCILHISETGDNPNSDMIVFKHAGSDIVSFYDCRLQLNPQT